MEMKIIGCISRDRSSRTPSDCAKAGHEKVFVHLLAAGAWLDRLPLTTGSSPGAQAWQLLSHNSENTTVQRNWQATRSALARSRAQPRALGLALRSAGLLENSANGIDLRRHAFNTLEGSQVQLELLYALPIPRARRLRCAGTAPTPANPCAPRRKT